jgi:transposase InsO family protein
MDLFVVPTISFRLLYHDRRQILWLGLTAHPTSEWMARQLTEACGWERTPKYLVRDHDAVYGEIFTRRLPAMGIRDRPIAPRSPWQNMHAERLIGSLRRECLDHVVVYGERHCANFCLLIWPITTLREPIYHWTRMRRYRGLFKPLGAFMRAQFSADYIIGTFGFNLR